MDFPRMGGIRALTQHPHVVRCRGTSVARGMRLPEESQHRGGK